MMIEQPTISPTTERIARYHALKPRPKAFVTVNCLRRIGKLVWDMKARKLTFDEAEQLSDEDFAGWLGN